MLAHANHRDLSPVYILLDLPRLPDCAAALSPVAPDPQARGCAWR